MIMETTTVTTTVLKSAKDKILRRISDGWIAGQEIYLGYTYYLGSRKLDQPLLELPEHYEEVDIPEEFSNEM